MNTLNLRSATIIPVARHIFTSYSYLRAQFLNSSHKISYLLIEEMIACDEITSRHGSQNKSSSFDDLQFLFVIPRNCIFLDHTKFVARYAPKSRQSNTVGRISALVTFLLTVLTAVGFALHLVRLDNDPALQAYSISKITAKNLSSTLILDSIPATPERKTQMTIVPFGNPKYSNFGAEVIGANFMNMTTYEFQALKDALYKFKVIVFRKPAGLTVEAQRQFTSQFGPLHVHKAKNTHLDGFTDVNVVSNIRNAANQSIGLQGADVESFHVDLSWEALPTSITFLKSVILPTSGGETHFSNSMQAYRDFESDIKAKLQGLRGHYTYMKFRENIPGASPNLTEQIKLGVDHPLIMNHPVTKQKTILANPADTLFVYGKSSTESDEILNILYGQVAKPEYEYVHQWREGDAVMWDNLAIQHRASANTVGPRMLIRTTASSVQRPFELIDL